jgi:predicted nucleotidyltransferase
MQKEIGKILEQYFVNKPVHRAYLFGSVVRNEQKMDSDIDILVELDYENGADYFIFFDMQQQLNKLLNRKVDLISAKGLSPYIKPIINREKKLVYERRKD